MLQIYYINSTSLVTNNKAKAQPFQQSLILLGLPQSIQYIPISRQTVVNHETKKKQHVCIQACTTTMVSYFDGWQLYIFKMLQLSHYYRYHLVYYKPSTSYLVEPTAVGWIKSMLPCLRTSQSRNFGSRFHDYSQNSTYTCIDTLLNTVLMEFKEVKLS